VSNITNSDKLSMNPSKNRVRDPVKKAKRWGNLKKNPVNPVESDMKQNHKF